LTRVNNEENPKDGGQGLSENTARKRCAIAKQMFADAMDRELIARNPFGKMEGLTVGASEGREYFVTRDEAEAVLEACPDAQWKLLFALSRYGGLRCPSEHLGLRWGYVESSVEIARCFSGSIQRSNFGFGILYMRQIFPDPRLTRAE
jgi:hypothetical protein